jgi:hypothetical protein
VAEQGVWDALFETLVELGLTERWQHMIDSTTVRGHSQAAGTKGTHKEAVWSTTRRLYDENPRPRRRSGRPLGFVLTGGETSDYAEYPI